MATRALTTISSCTSRRESRLCSTCKIHSFRPSCDRRRRRRTMTRKLMSEVSVELCFIHIFLIFFFCFDTKFSLIFLACFPPSLFGHLTHHTFFFTTRIMIWSHAGDVPAGRPSNWEEQRRQSFAGRFRSAKDFFISVFGFHVSTNKLETFSAYH